MTQSVRVTERVMVSVSFHMCAIMKFAKYGKTYFDECFIRLLTNCYALPNFFIIYLDSVDNMQQCDIVFMIIWRRRHCAHSPVNASFVPNRGLKLFFKIQIPKVRYCWLKSILSHVAVLLTAIYFNSV